MSKKINSVGRGFCAAFGQMHLQGLIGGATGALVGGVCGGVSGKEVY